MAHKNWTIAVVGAGAVGSHFGGLLAHSGNSVTLIGRASHAEAIKRNGLRLRSGGNETRIAVTATTDMAAVSSADLVLFCVKSFDTEEAAAAIAPHLAPGAVILSLQNGVDNLERIRRHVTNRVIPVLIYAGSNIPEAGVVQHTGGNSVVMGLTRDSRAQPAAVELIGQLAALLQEVGFSATISDDIETDLWTKLVMNCAYNAISALSGLPYGRMVAVPEVRTIMREIVDETAQIARANGVSLPEDIAEQAMRLAEAMPTTTSSTAQDIAKGRRTEIDHLNGYVVRQGEALGIPTPVNRTINALIKLREQGGQPQA